MIKYVFPIVIENFYLYSIAGWDIYGLEIIIATLALVIFGYLNIKGAGLTGQMQFLFAMAMVAGVVIITITVGFQPGAGLSNIQPLFPSNTTAFVAIISIVAIAPWAFSQACMDLLWLVAAYYSPYHARGFYQSHLEDCTLNIEHHMWPLSCCPVVRKRGTCLGLRTILIE